MFAEVAPDQYLYHYTSLETALVRIIPTGKLRAVSLSQVNDPREYSDWYLNAVVDLDMPGEDVSNEEFVALSKIVNEEVRKRLKVLCFAADKPSAAAMEPPDYEFGRGYAHSRMWDQYADRHRGVCLIFDRARIESLSHSSAMTKACPSVARQCRIAIGRASIWTPTR